MMSVRKLKTFLFVTSFVEGGSLMAVEVLGSKIMAPFYGTTILVWTSVIGATLGGLALGYFLGGKLIKDQFENDFKTLNFIVLLSGLFLIFILLFSRTLLDLSMMFPVKIGVTISGILILSPVLILFGTVSPIIINLITDNAENTSRNSGLIYAISTFSGILFTLFVGLYSIPFLGIKATIFAISIILITNALIGFYIIKKHAFS